MKVVITIVPDMSQTTRSKDDVSEELIEVLTRGLETFLRLYPIEIVVTSVVSGD